jgi:hypothetical protein
LSSAALVAPIETSTPKEVAPVPTNVYFMGRDKPLKLEDDYQTVNEQLQTAHGGHFTRAHQDRHMVTVYKAAVAYTEDTAKGQELADALRTPTKESNAAT